MVRIPGRGFALVLVAVVLALVVLAGAPQQAAARDRTDAVTGWIDVELAEIAAHRTNPPRASRGLALLSMAMLKATKVPRGHQEAAVAGAVSTVLTYLYPDRADAFAELTIRKRPKHALAAGRRIGERVVANSRTDGSDAVWQGTVPVGAGLWVPTPPAFAPPLEVLAGTWRTWNIRSGSQFLPDPPPAFGGKAYAREVAEVYKVSRSLTDEQKQIANFWADVPGTVTPTGHWNQIALELIRGHRLSAPAAARVLAALNTAQADAFIACWNAKFTYWSERPVTAIRRELDPSWLSYIGTPPFPSYVSGHSSTSGAASRVLAAYFRDAAPQLRAWAEEAAVSRLYGGIHFRRDNEAGLVLGRKVAKAAISRYLARPTVRR
jgi:membrane-associated phospholipid phosphatase